MSDIAKNNISVYMTAKDSGQKVTQINLSHLLFRNNTNIPTIKLNKSETLQEILGFGGAFTEAAASVYHKLDNEKKKKLFKPIFGNRETNTAWLERI